ncbi:hypothetical protein KKH15_00085 [Patescibacteria group bacterium]|nr:hypothetical protein [Patescibacteria group bacterium]MBU0801441.1 hypothetical protein [Alphaproteobacteria bacterium]MBU1754722.1 hypothetical protein [Patescibacteria group bacterium]
MKNTIIILAVLIVLGVAAYFLYPYVMKKGDTMTPEEVTTSETMTPGEAEQMTDDSKTVLGSSVQGRDITAYHYGTGDTNLLFVGGLHGGYEWNTTLVAYQLMDYLEQNPTIIPANVRVTVIPAVNPDGLFKVVNKEGRFVASDVPTVQAETIPGRYNANNVDLNRNFACDWQKDGMWRSTPVSGGSAAFSEPESAAIRDYVAQNKPSAVVVWYSAAGGVYASNCHKDVLPETVAMMNTYAKASGYSAHQTYNYYEITGDMVNWLAKEGIPGISVLLTNHTDTEWSKNKAGIDALLKEYAN